MNKQRKPGRPQGSKDKVKRRSRGTLTERDRLERGVRPPRLNTKERRAQHMAGYNAVALAAKQGGPLWGSDEHLRALELERKLVRQQRAGIDVLDQEDG